MQSIILSAGQGTRLRPITYHVPKPMIRVRGRNFLERSISLLPFDVNEVILVVGYKKEQIINHFGEEWNGKKIQYVVQKKLLGTAQAVKECEGLIRDKFLVMMGDDIYSREDVRRLVRHDNAILTKEVRGKFTGGRIKLNPRGCLKEIVEGTHNKSKGLICTGMYVLTPDFFKYRMVKLPGRNEYGLPQTIVSLAHDLPVKIERASSWQQISDLADLEKFKKNQNRS